MRAVAIAAALAVVLGIAGAVWFLNSNAPEAVDIATAVEQAEQSSSSAPAASASATGAWSVTTDIGEFSITENSGTFVGVRVEEELANIGATTAVVRTPAVSGSITLDGSRLTAAEIVADFTALISDEARRENAVHRALNTATYPTATFVLTEPVELDALPAEGTQVAAVATGEMTIAGQTNTVEVPLDVALVDGVAVVTGSFDVAFADYGVAVPSAPVVVSAEDHGTVELQLFLTQ